VRTQEDFEFREYKNVRNVAQSPNLLLLSDGMAYTKLREFSRTQSRLRPSMQPQLKRTSSTRTTCRSGLSAR
jgi:hypothetical protein